MYQALYRKWRPLVFADVAGQPHVTQTLRNQVEGGRLSHAYLFTGSRGTGKTTCAKILARAACCTQPKKGDPCNNCSSCLGILDGRVPDVMEIDAASNSGVDNIRALREELVYTPVAVSKRVYIIDEVHMLSPGAFNALLKTLEEPPGHVLFILATTETHKVPATIISRCQRFAFHRIAQKDIAARLWQVAQSENILLQTDALQLLANMADGSLRDGLSLLDQCAGLAETIDIQLCLDTLGLAGRSEMAQWLCELCRNETSGALERLDRLYQAGQDFSSILDELGSLMRDLLMGQMLDDLSSLRLPEASVAELNSLCPREELLKTISLLQETQNRLPRSVNKRLETEMFVFRVSCGVQTAPQLAGEQAPVTASARSKAVAPPQSAEPQPTDGGVTSFSEPPQKKLPPPTKKTAPGDGWRQLLSWAADNKFFKDALDQAECSEEGEKLILNVPNTYIKGVLGQEVFRQRVMALYPGGVEIVVPGRAGTSSPAYPPEKENRLKALQDGLGSNFHIVD
ncbi:MAG: DNA polymerase III subunit gamma/tau [Oscillospiraceae bacterium]|nr:DNA polymerase III subunit gamma/tau [Oscillospiraceae bacterium]